MKRIMVIVFCFITNIVWGSYFSGAILNGDLTVINEYLNYRNDTDVGIFWKFSSGFFELDKNELRLLRNTIYAKYGYKFNSPDLQRHFSQFSWYNGTKTNVDTELTEVDKENIRLIQKIEANYPNLVYENFSGCWIIPEYNLWDAIDDEKYSSSRVRDLPFFNIYPNGTFYISMNGAGFHGCYYGLWAIENNKLVLKYFFENEHFLESPDFAVSDNLLFLEIVSPNGKKYTSSIFFKHKGDWIKISNYVQKFDK
jgi:hypothetical protein